MFLVNTFQLLHSVFAWFIWHGKNERLVCLANSRRHQWSNFLTHFWTKKVCFYSQWPSNGNAYPLLANFYNSPNGIHIYYINPLLQWKHYSCLWKQLLCDRPVSILWWSTVKSFLVILEHLLLLNIQIDREFRGNDVLSLSFSLYPFKDNKSHYVPCPLLNFLL